MAALAEKMSARTVEFPGGCHVWIGTLDREGYGRVFHSGTMRGAHRVAYEMAHGPIGALPKADARGTCVCHRCDNRRCVNPDHLFLGTHADNMRDMARKGRHAMPSTAGERNGNAKLSAGDVSAIRDSDAPSKALAERFKVSACTIRHVRRGYSWGRK
jgi:hypothetical protein